jgi:hypothetical protein
MTDFTLFDSLNPHIWAKFKEITFRLIERKVPRISSKFVWEIVRYEAYMETDREEWNKYRLNNNFTAYYGRKFVDQYPEHKNKFEFRAIKSLVI